MATRFAGSKIANFLGDKPNYDEIGSQGTIDAAKGVANTALNNARAADATMRSEAEVLAAEANADAIRATGQAQANAALANTIGSSIGGLAGSIGSMGSMGGDSYGGTGSTGGLGDTVKIGDTGKYGSFQDPRESFSKLGYTQDTTTGLFSRG